MPEATFYVLQSDSQRERFAFACRLIEKAYRSGQFGYVLTDSDAQSQLIDDLLWTFRAGSFIPHQQVTGELPALKNIFLIGSTPTPQAWQKLVINLSNQSPQNFQQATRILEILDNSEATKEPGRQRWIQYKQAGFDVTKHEFDKAVD
ncbi:MAG: DNA polymerase III subunit chi [Methylococcaceae bacterium]|nr:DNA polymerase III subunit chi [Methylococcaceae bacterium]MDZ4156763.1 DNA polymerase III subunit chi [Methylococcales bacterium]MDP2393333.1 DNA polymerase III subunit chi [Methylococcaceae bacterium]MDP3018346.1 DNA polymerase III subunit chi [Methylococcaceae bacterium]MDP3388564.1 DNA polymerase III subunit chi [Methylococcaceae bacterium]